MEHINRELTTALGLGAHQVRGEEGRIEKSFGIAVLAYLYWFYLPPRETAWERERRRQAYFPRAGRRKKRRR